MSKDKLNGVQTLKANIELHCLVRDINKRGKIGVGQEQWRLGTEVGDCLLYEEVLT